MLCFKKEKYFELNVLKDFEHLQAETDFETLIIDFGLAKNLEASLNENSTSNGNNMYKPPETIGCDQDEGFGHRNSDMFSLAAITAKVLCNLKDNKQIHSYDEDVLIKKVKSALSSKEDPCVRIFKKILPKMLVFDPKE